MGKNSDSSASSSKANRSVPPGKNVFRIRVVEHLSWDVYNETKQCFYPGEDKNMPIAGRKFKIKILGGKEFTATTDADGVIELKDQKPTDTYEITFEPESAKMNNKYHLFYNRSTPVKKALKGTSSTSNSSGMPGKIDNFNDRQRKVFSERDEEIKNQIESGQIPFS